MPEENCNRVVKMLEARAAISPTVAATQVRLLLVYRMRVQVEDPNRRKT